MLMSVTNVSGRAIHAPITYDTNVDPLLGTAGLIAESSGLFGNDKGSKSDPLPYPFDRGDELANSATRQLPVHPQDFTRNNHWDAQSPATLWNQMIQMGIVTIAWAAEPGVSDVEEDYLATL